MRRKHDRLFVFKLFDIFKHLRGSGTVDKIKKFRRDFLGDFYPPRPWIATAASGYGDNPMAKVDKNHLGNPSRYSLL